MAAIELLWTIACILCMAGTPLHGICGCPLLSALQVVAGAAVLAVPCAAFLLLAGRVCVTLIAIRAALF